MRQLIGCTSAALMMMLVLGGCGSDGPSGPRGMVPQCTAQFGVQWGQRSAPGAGTAAAGPSSALSFVLTLAGASPDGSDYTFTQDRHDDPGPYSETYTLPGWVRPGPTTLSVTFHAQHAGAGDVVGVGHRNVQINQDGSGLGDVAVEGTVDYVGVPAGQTIGVGQTRALAVTVLSAPPNAALLAVTPGSVFWHHVESWPGDECLRFSGCTATGLADGQARCTATVDGHTSQAELVDVGIGMKGTILTMYAPLVYLHSQEAHRPSSVEWFFDRTERYWREEGASSEVPDYSLRVRPVAGQPVPNYGYWLNDHPDGLYRGMSNLADVPAYAFWIDRPDEDKIELVYFFFYPFNRGKETRIRDIVLDSELANIGHWGNHVGDWEFMTALLERAPGQFPPLGLPPNDLVLGQHDSRPQPGAPHRAATWAGLGKADGSHPVVYSAKDSHATYGAAGSLTYQYVKLLPGAAIRWGYIRLNDVCDQGDQWRTWQNLEMFDYSAQPQVRIVAPGRDATWPTWMSTEWTSSTSGAIRRWGNTYPADPDLYTYCMKPIPIPFVDDVDFCAVFGHRPWADAPTGPATKLGGQDWWPYP